MILINILLLKKVNIRKFCCKVSQGNLTSKNDIAVLVKKIGFHKKLKNLNKNVTSNNTRHILVENELNELSKKS